MKEEELREIDRQLAEAMGCTVRSSPYTHPFTKKTCNIYTCGCESGPGIIGSGQLSLDASGILGPHGGKIASANSLHKYSTDPAACKLVKEWLLVQGNWLKIVSCDGIWVCEAGCKEHIESRWDEVEAEAETEELAVALCAIAVAKRLKGVG